jgi:uncharacterized repeat protein (TIGR01451 family)
LAVEVPVLSITKSHIGSFTLGQQGASYTVKVSNGIAATTGGVTVTEAAPPGLTLVSMTGTGWNCSSNMCTRYDSLASGASYPPISVTVNVDANAASPQINTASVSAGGSAGASASDVTSVMPFSPCDLKHSGNATVSDVQLVISEASGVSPAINDLSGDGVVNIFDVQIEISAALGLGCAAR